MAGMNTVGRYHTNDGGKTLPCTAGVRECQFVHGATPDEAASNWQNVMANELIPSAISAYAPQARLQFYRAMKLKEMDDRQLAEAIILESAERNFNTAKVAEAIALASVLHGEQFRKGSRGNVERPPYIEHPLRNTLRLIRIGTSDEKVIIASILHDTVEDGSIVFAKNQGVSSEDAENEHAARKLLTVHIELRFGTDTTEIVIAVTNAIPDGDPRAMSADEKHQIYVLHLRAHVLHSPEAFLVKISDFIDNATGLYHGVGTMDPVKLRNQARKYLLSVPIFEEGLETLDLPIPEHSKELLKKGLKETARRLEKIIAGWDGTSKI